MHDALTGIRVLDLSRLLPGPFLTMILSDMGADVVKVEAPNIGDYLRPMPPAKGGMSGRFLAVNRNKRSLVLDLKTPAGKDAFLRMAAHADVVVESFRPGVIDRLGVGWDALRAKNPGLILCSISGYGQTGPYRGRAGHDLNYLALAGVLAMGGARGGAPWQPGVQIADFAGGGMWGAIGVLGALYRRRQTGEGAHLDIAMTEGALTLLTAELGNLECDPPEPPTRGNQALNGGLACYRIYRTRDGKYVSVGALEPKFWLALGAAVGRNNAMSELVGAADRQDEVAAELQRVFETRTQAEWVEHFRAHDCCVEPVLELDELADHPLHRAREVFFELDHEGDGREDKSDVEDARADDRPVRQLRTPLGAPSRRRMPPRLGEHSEQVLREYGFSDSEINALLG